MSLLEEQFNVRLEYAARARGWIAKWERARDELDDRIAQKDYYVGVNIQKRKLINAFLQDLNRLRAIYEKGMPGDIKDFLAQRTERMKKENLSFHLGRKK